MPERHFDIFTEQRITYLSRLGEGMGSAFLKSVTTSQPSESDFNEVVNFFRKVGKEDISGGTRQHAWVERASPWCHEMETAYLAIAAAKFLNSTRVFNINPWKVANGAIFHDAARVLVEPDRNHRIVHNDRINAVLLDKLGVASFYEKEVMHDIDWLLFNKNNIFDETDLERPKVDIEQAIDDKKITVEQVILKLADTLSKRTSPDMLLLYPEWLGDTLNKLQVGGHCLTEDEVLFKAKAYEYARRDMALIRGVWSWFNAIEDPSRSIGAANEVRLMRYLQVKFDWLAERDMLLL